MQDGRRRQSIANVINSDQIETQSSEKFLPVENVERELAPFHGSIARSPIVLRAESKGLAEAIRFAADLECHRAVGANGEVTALRNQIDEARELKPYCVQVRVNIGMVELYVSHYRHIGEVVHEFRALIKKSGVVFVALHDERRASFHPIAGSKVFRNAAYQAIGTEAREVEHPCDHGSGRSFPMGARYDNHFLVAQEFVMQDLR